MPSKHELLDYMAYNGQVTIYEVMEHFGTTHQNISNAMVSLKRIGIVKNVGKIQFTKNVRPRKLFELTNNGLQRLEYFNENGCKNQNCSCQKET
ncbi:MAG: hypothetical protein Q8M94_21180 [Ignavibacteria bacterium]|nr:hypothetical protein [Ignavibacteria bacterium]